MHGWFWSPICFACQLTKHRWPTDQRPDAKKVFFVREFMRRLQGKKSSLERAFLSNAASAVNTGSPLYSLLREERKKNFFYGKWSHAESGGFGLCRCKKNLVLGVVMLGFCGEGGGKGFSLFFCCPLNNGKTEETKVDLVKVAPGAKNYWKILALNNPFPTYKYYFFSNFIIHSNYLFSLPDHVSSTLDLSKALNRLGERALSRDNSGGDCEILSEEEEELGAAFQKFSVLTRELSGLMRDAMASLDGSLLFPTDRWERFAEEQGFFPFISNVLTSSVFVLYCECCD